MSISWTAADVHCCSSAGCGVWMSSGGRSRGMFPPPNWCGSSPTAFGLSQPTHDHLSLRHILGHYLLFHSSSAYLYIAFMHDMPIPIPIPIPFNARLLITRSCMFPLPSLEEGVGSPFAQRFFTPYHVVLSTSHFLCLLSLVFTSGIIPNFQVILGGFFLIPLPIFSCVPRVFL